VGTPEFVDLCRRVKAEPLMCVNFLGDGEARYRNTKEGDRTADAKEAADWVTYANDPSNKERGAEPYGIKLWQLGNETSYGNATFRKDEAIAHTIEFARAMRARDKSIKLIGWGDRGREGYWARDMVERAGEWIDMVAFHMMGQSPIRKDTVLRGLRWQKEPDTNR
jgi:alpha-L-arabinofuranosidase